MGGIILDGIALWLGRAVIAAAALAAISIAWWMVGSAVWAKVLPSRLKRRWMRIVAGGIYFTPVGLFVMFLLGGPLGALHAPAVRSAQSIKRAERKEAESSVIEGRERELGIGRWAAGDDDGDDDEAWLERAEAAAEIHADWEREAEEDSDA